MEKYLLDLNRVQFTTEIGRSPVTSHSELVEFEVRP
jgi:hypothetical protein